MGREREKKPYLTANRHVGNLGLESGHELRLLAVEKLFKIRQYLTYGI